jgi:putative DNA primase/helicase
VTANSLAFDAWTARARSVPIEEELARRGVNLRGKIERCGSCPKCGGDDRFSINTAKQIFNCRGCDTGGDVIDLVRHLDGVDFTTACTTLAHDPPPKANGKDHAAEPREVTTARYLYQDEAGATLFMVGRIEYQNANGTFVFKDGKRKKTFKQKRPNPDKAGAWLYNVDGVRIVPYKLPELIEAIGNGYLIVVAEGEAKVDLLRSWNVPATCCAGGAKKWRPEHSEFLRGADVVILPDNDDAGRAHCVVVGVSLENVANSVRVLDLPSLPPKGDILDWAHRGGTVEQFHDLIAHEAKPWAPNNHKADEDPELNTTKKQAPMPEQNTGPAEFESAPASSFKMVGLNWLWPNRFALGKLGLIAGLPDRGKGLITADMTARVTNGDMWPCGEGRALKGRVLILSAEDDVEDTIVPRLVAAGADLTQVEILRMVRTGDSKRMFSLVSDIELLWRKVDELGNVVMIDIDPMSAYLGVGKIDSYRTTDVRGVLAPLTEFAASKQVFVLGVLHFNKKTDVNNAMLRISDSLAFAATARHCYVVVDDSENDRRLFVKAKNNLAPDTKALSYGVNAVDVGNDEKTGKAIWAPRVVWGLEHVEITATQAMEAEIAGKTSTNPRATAKIFLADMLENGPVAKQEIDEAAEANGISTRTLMRAKAELNIVAKKVGMQGGWTWQLPELQASPRRYND